ncbi:hypothetical protein [Lacticaseibacillus jixiensis]|uniref:hypothetical protein n=1 Tax=Lacticaseibacillus jixiensis TaxID=3231926 RepID=UPI0036F24584
MEYICSDLADNIQLPLSLAIAHFVEHLRPGHMGHIVSVLDGDDPVPALSVDYRVDEDGEVHVVDAIADWLPEPDFSLWQQTLAPYHR